MAGVTHRVSEIFEVLDKIPDTHDATDDLSNNATSHGDSDSDATRQLVQVENNVIVQGKPEQAMVLWIITQIWGMYPKCSC